MRRTTVLRSVLTRLVVVFIVGGLVVSVGWGWLQWQHRRSLVELGAAQRVAATTRDFQSVLKRLIERSDRRELEHALNVFAATQPVRAVRLRAPGEPAIVLGDAAALDGRGVATVPVTEGAAVFVDPGVGVGDGPVVFRAPLEGGDRPYVLEVLFDGRALSEAERALWLENTQDDVLLVGALSLLVLLLVRRWFAVPLAEIAELVRVGARHEVVAGLAQRQRGEFRELSAALAEALERVDRDAAELARRDREEASLRRLAPVALVEVDRGGVIVGVNEEATSLLGVSCGAVVGGPVTDLVVEADRPAWSQAMERLRVEDAADWRLRLRGRPGGEVVDVAVRASAARDESGAPVGVRLALVDATPEARLRGQLQEKTRLLELLVDHLPDAVVLTDAGGRVVGSNQQAARLLRKPAASLRGGSVHAEGLWSGLGLLEPERFAERVRRAESGERSSPERVETQTGIYLLHSTPVPDAEGAVGVRLWVLRDVTQHERSEWLLSQQKRQLQALRCIGPALINVRDVDRLLETTAEQVFDVVGVDGVGVAMRDGRRVRRTKQLIHRGKAGHLIEQNRRLIESVERELMPQVLGQPDALFWPDLEVVGTGWSRAFVSAGFTSLAAAPVRSAIEMQGILWIARRGGERIEQHQLHLIETLCPLLAARLEMAQLTERLQGLHLMDPVTGLPSHLQFERAMQTMMGRPGQLCALVVVDLDGFRAHNDRLGREACDGVLRAAAVRLLGVCRKSGFLARFAGASFGLLAPDLDPAQAERLGERLREVLGREAFAVSGVGGASQTTSSLSGAGATGSGPAWGIPGVGECRVTASVGVACFPSDELRAEELLELALIRVASAKRLGHDRVVATGADPSRQAG